MERATLQSSHKVDWEAYAEADRRGILPAGKKALFEEAKSRGLVPKVKLPPGFELIEDGGAVEDPVGGTLVPTGEFSTITGKPVTRFNPSSGPEAGFGTQIKASFVDDPYMKAKIFSQARGIPITRYRVNWQGKLEYRDDEGKWNRETWELPTSKLESLAADVVGHPSTYLAPSAVALGPWGPPAAAVMGEGIRKTIGRDVFGRRSSSEKDTADQFGEAPGAAQDLIDMGMQGIFALAGSGAGKALISGINKYVNRAAAGGPGILRKTVTRAGIDLFSPEEKAKAAFIQQLASQHGIPLSPHQIYDRQSLTDLWAYLRRYPTTSDRIKTQEGLIQNASAQELEWFIRKMGGYDKTPYQVGQELKGRAEKAIGSAESNRSEAVRPLYEKAKDLTAQREAGGEFINLEPALYNLDRVIESYPEGRIRSGLLGIKKMLTKPGKELVEKPGPYGYLEDPMIRKPQETLVGWIRSKGGIDPKDWGDEFSARQSGIVAMSNQRGRSMDELLAQALDEGWVPPGTDERSFVNLIKQDMRASTSRESPRVLKQTAVVRIEEPNLKEVPTRLPESNLERLQKALFELNDLIEGTSYEASRIAPSSKRVLNRELERLKKDILGAIEKVSPEFIEANKVYEKMSPPIEKLKASVIGELTRMRSDATTSQASHKLLDVRAMPDPALLATARKEIERQDPALWRQMVGSYISDTLETIRSTQEGKIQNLPGKVASKLWGSQRQRDILEAAMTPRDFKQFSDLMTVFERAAIGWRNESMTAQFQAIDRSLRGNLAQGAVGLVMEPKKTVGEFILNKWEDLLMHGRQGAFVEALTAPDVVKRINAAKRMTPGSERLVRETAVILGLIADQSMKENP